MTNALARLAFLEDENNKLRERAEAAEKRAKELWQDNVKLETDLELLRAQLANAQALYTAERDQHAETSAKLRGQLAGERRTRYEPQVFNARGKWKAVRAGWTTDSVEKAATWFKGIGAAERRIVEVTEIRRTLDTADARGDSNG